MTPLSPQAFTVKTQAGDERTYVLHKFDAISGREIVAKYPMSSVPKLGDYAVNEETMFKLMAFVAVDLDSKMQFLTTKALITNHIPDWETLARIEWAMLEYNTSFFGDGKTLATFAGIGETLKAWITSILTASLAASSERTRPPSTN